MLWCHSKCINHSYVFNSPILGPHVHMHINCFLDFFVAGAVYYKICTCIHTLHRVYEHGPIILLKYLNQAAYAN